MAFSKNQTLGKLDLVFSRDGNKKEYVQYIIRQKKQEFVEWVKRGAHIYVCGSIPMALGVKKAMEETFRRSRKIDGLNFRRLMNLNRYHEDVY